MQSRTGEKFLPWPSTHFAQISERQADCVQNISSLNKLPAEF